MEGAGYLCVKSQNARHWRSEQKVSEKIGYQKETEDKRRKSLVVVVESIDPGSEQGAAAGKMRSSRSREKPWGGSARKSATSNKSKASQHDGVGARRVGKGKEEKKTQIRRDWRSCLSAGILDMKE